MTETYLFFDTETTDVPIWDRPSKMASQPHIVQLTALLTDERGDKLSSMDLLVKPEGWESTPKAFETHGITVERGLRGGVPENDAVDAFWALLCQSTGLVCHGVPFDKRMLRIAMSRFQWSEDYREALREKPAFCTMKHATKICDLPPTQKMINAGRGGQRKQASLAEAYHHFTNKKLEGAHNAMVDVLACKTVFFGILDHLGMTEVEWDTPGRAPAKSKAKPKTEAPWPDQAKPDSHFDPKERIEGKFPAETVDDVI